MGSAQMEETSAYCTVNHRASRSNYQLSYMKRPIQDSNRWPQRLEARTLTTTPPSPHPFFFALGLRITLVIHLPLHLCLSTVKQKVEETGYQMHNK